MIIDSRIEAPVTGLTHSANAEIDTTARFTKR